MTIFEQMTDVFAALKTTLEVCRTTAPTLAQREDIEADLCLATRDAYTDFHSLSLVHQVIDPDAKELLASYLNAAFVEFKYPDFSDAVAERKQEFMTFCDWMENNRDWTEMVFRELMSEESKH